MKKKEKNVVVVIQKGIVSVVRVVIDVVLDTKWIQIVNESIILVVVTTAVLVVLIVVLIVVVKRRWICLRILLIMILL